MTLLHFMRPSLRKGAHAVLSSAAWQEIRVRFGRDDKEKVTVPERADAGPRRYALPWVGRRPMTPPVEMTNLLQLSFRIFLGNAELSSRPERTRISCHAALDKAACAPFRKEGRMKYVNAIKVNRKSGVA